MVASSVSLEQCEKYRVDKRDCLPGRASGTGRNMSARRQRQKKAARAKLGGPIVAGTSNHPGPMQGASAQWPRER